MTQLSVSEARAILPELLDRIADGEEITITRHGKPAAVLLRPDAVRARRGAEAIEKAREIGAMIAAARKRPLSEGGLPPGWGEELVAEIRADRDRS